MEKEILLKSKLNQVLILQSQSEKSLNQIQYFIKYVEFLKNRNQKLNI